MSNTNGLSYSATLSKGIDPSKQQQNQHPQAAQAQAQRQTQSSPSTNLSRNQFPPSHVKRAPSPSHIPKGSSEEENLYVLTLLTDKPLHNRMTALRNQYFPKKINKVAAHLTLFHALPESKLESSIMPTIQDVISKTAPFKVVATEPFRMKKGFAINISSSQGGSQAKGIHRALQGPWKQEGWLSEQDAGGCRVHYTLMNKVDDEVEVGRAFEELKEEWKGDEGVCEGVALWRYDRGWWRWERAFTFKKD